MKDPTLPRFRSDDELLTYAVIREERSHRFYLDLAAQITDQPMRQLFHDFARRELAHKAKLELEQMKTGRVVPEPQSPIQPPDPESIDAAAMTYPEVFILAIQRERESFRLYIDLADVAYSDQMREMLLSLAEEEAKHHALFELELERANQPD